MRRGGIGSTTPGWRFIVGTGPRMNCLDAASKDEDADEEEGEGAAEAAAAAAATVDGICGSASWKRDLR